MSDFFIFRFNRFQIFPEKRNFFSLQRIVKKKKVEMDFSSLLDI